MSVTVRIKLDEVLRVVEKLERPKVERAISAGLKRGMLAIERDVIRNKMSGQYLGVVTGTARKSIRSEVRKRRDRILGVVGSPLNYVRAHEEGFRGVVDVRAHERTRRGRTHRVQAHSRQVNMRARHFLRDSVRENVEETERKILESLVRLLETGKVSAPGSL